MDAVLNWLWQGGVVTIAALVMLFVLERARANVRYLVCWAALLAVAALPVLSALQFSAVSAGAFPAPQGEAVISLPDTWWTSTLVVFAAWSVWTTIQLVRFAAAIAAVRRARAHSRPFPAHVESQLPQWVRERATGRRTSLVLSDSLPSAAVLGWGAPMIAVSPLLVKALDPDELDRVLIHEWAHVQRRDDLVNLVQIVVRAVVGWHPALWWLDRRLHVEREIACDEMTVAITGSPKTYAECLVKLAGLRGASRTMLAAAALLTSSGLRARIVKLVSARPSIAPAWSRGIAGAIVTIVCLLSIGLSGLTLVEAAALALPIVSTRALGATVHRIAPIAAPMLSSDFMAERPVRTARRMPAARQPETPQVPFSQPPTESNEPVAPAGAAAPDSMAAIDAHPEATMIPGPAILPQIPPGRSDTAAETSRTPWTAAADGGVTIARKSRDAGLATAGFFSRFARRVAGSF